MIVRSRSTLLFCVALIACFLVYWQGLSGPFLFDDYWNLTPVEQWHAGTRSWRQALLPNPASIVASRPVSMASFMLTIWMGGLGTFPVKLGNLILHLLCGLISWWVLRNLFRRDPRLSQHADLLAAAAASVWLLHPLNVSTVLYSVQRMTQLSMAFTMIALAAYLLGRTALADGKTKRAAAWLFVGFPTAVLLGVLSKQNAAIAPFLCLAIEIAYFSRQRQHRPYIAGFFLMFAALPSVAAVLLMALNPDAILVGYRDWGFTLEQRLLTQPRALLDYVGMLLLPHAPSMGLYTDDFPISTGLLQPVTTLISMIALTLVSVLAAALRTRAPTVFVGWFFFLIAHGVESTFLPLEMYYEHRNYLPAIGLFAAVAGLIALIPSSFRPQQFDPRKLGMVAISLFLLVLSFATLGRVLVWQHKESIIEQGFLQHPDSMHARSEKVALEIEQGDFAAAEKVLAPMPESDAPRARIVGNLYLAALDCIRGHEFDSGRLRAATSDAMPQFTVYEAQMMKLLEQSSSLGRCRGTSERDIADAIDQMLAAAVEQPEASPNKHVMRELAARLYARSGRWDDAEEQAQVAWEHGRNPPAGAMLTRILLHNGKLPEARVAFQEVKPRIDPGDPEGQRELAELARLITKSERNSAGVP